MLNLTEEQINQEIEIGKKLNKISQLKQYLSDTDYIDNKLTEAVVEFIKTGDNSNVLELRQKYSKELVDRKNWREEINRVEEELK